MNRLLDAVLSCGAYRAALIEQAQIDLSEEFRDICRSNSCGNYGKCYTCPPDIGEIRALMAQVRQYPKAILYQSVSSLEDSFDFEGMMAAGEAHAQLSQRIQDALTPLLTDFLHLSAGGCHLCPTCAKREALPCRFPDRRLPPVEGYGINVYNTTKDTGLKYINGPNTVTYFGMVLFTE